MVTRVVHRVRCRKKDNKQIWADVKVVDAIVMKGTDGKEKLVYVRAKSAKPYIADNTTGNNGKGDKRKASRTSHMVLAQAADDSTQKMYVEVLDSIALVNITPLSEASDLSGADGPPSASDAALDGKGEITLVFPDKKARRLVVDKVGLGLATGADAADKASRSGHVSLVTEKGNTDDKTGGIEDGDPVPPEKMAWAAVVKPDCLHVAVTGDQVITMYISKKAQDELDTTKETTDPETGEPCPPDNTDPHVYVTFPADAGDPNGPCIGCNVKIPLIGRGKVPDIHGNFSASPTGERRPIDQGPLWWIERISSPFQPWFWFATVQEPRAFSFFGNPGRLGSWAYRGWVLFNNYPVIWILARNNPLISMGSFGSPSLDLCARFGNWDFGFPTVPSSPVGIPQRPAGVAFPFTGLSFAEPVDPSESGGTYAPFGCLQMTHPPLGPLPDAVPYGLTLGGNNGSELWSSRPTIFQLTGLPSPKRLDTSRIFDPFTNPILPPSAADAKAAALAFRDNWNSAANGHNGFISDPGFIASANVPGGNRLSYDQPPGWNWAVPFYDPLHGPKYYGAFVSGIVYGVASGVGFPLVDFIPATAYNLDVDQLDPQVWEVSHLELFNNPLNWFLPIVIPPQLKPGQV